MTETKTSPTTDLVEQKAPSPASPTEGVAAFVRNHPFITVAGGIAIGLVAGALLPRGAGRKLVSRAATLAELGAAAGLAFGREAMDKAEQAGNAGRDLGRQAWEQAESTASSVGKRGEAAAEELVVAGERLMRKAAEFAGKLRH